jgi:hypothetical protein
MNNLIVDSEGNKKWYNSDGKLHRTDGPAVEYINGDKIWYLNGKKHREDGPAFEWLDGSKAWYINGKKHREDGPAFECSNGSKEWYLNGKLHRDDGPAVESSNGTKIWFKDGEYHRVDGPAIEFSNGSKEWFINGKRHRIDGPAVEWTNGIKRWRINDDYCSKERFDEIVNFPDRKIPYIVFDNSIYHIKFKDDLGIRLSYMLELYIDGKFIKWDWSLVDIILGFVRNSDCIGPLLDWIQEHSNYFPNEFIERLYY